MRKKKLTRINKADLTVRTINICNGLGIKTVYSAKKFNWKGLIGKRMKLGSGAKTTVTKASIDRVITDLKRVK